MRPGHIKDFNRNSCLQMHRAFLILLFLPTLAQAQVPKITSIEPSAVAPGETQTLVVHGTGLQNATSVWTNLDCELQLTGNKATERPPLRSVLSHAESVPAEAIIIEAEAYDRGTWGKRAPFILNVGGANANVAEWDVNVDAAGNYLLELNYASGASRPVKLSLNGQDVSDQAVSAITGGFGANDTKWIPECILSLKKGLNTVRMEKTGGTPHVDKLGLIPTSLPPTEFPSRQATDRLAPCRIHPGANVPVGIRALRLATEHGISNMLLFMVDDLPTLKEIAGHSSSFPGQQVHFPVGVEGYCDVGRPDLFALDVTAGQVLSFEAVAVRLGSRLDPVLKLWDAAGNELAFADDTPGLAGDCCIRHRFEESGCYVVGIEDALTSGSSAHRYRLRIGDFPLLTAPIPATVSPGQFGDVTFTGYAAEGVSVDRADPNQSRVSLVSGKFADSVGSGFTQLAVSDVPQFIVGNASADSSVSVPSGISGRFAVPGDSHDCHVVLRKGQRIQLTDVTRGRGGPALVAMSILDSKGRTLAAVRRAGATGQNLSWSAPHDGDYVLRLAELNGRGGPEFGFHVTLAEERPDFELIVEKDSSVLPQDGYVVLKVTVTRKGFNGPVQLSAQSLETEFQVRNSEIAAGAKETRLKIYVPPQSRVGQSLAFQIAGRAKIGDAQVERVASTRPAFRKAMPQATFPPVGTDGLVVVSIGRPIPDFFDLSLDGGEILFPRLVGEVYFTVRVKNRTDGFKDMVNVHVEGLPQGFSASGGEQAVSRSDNNEYRFQLRGPTDIPHSESVVRIVGEATYKGQTKEVELKKVPFRVIDPLIVTAECDRPIRAGNRGRITVNARRFVPRAGGDKAPIRIEFDAVPLGVSLPEMVSIPAGRDSVEFEFSVSDNAGLSEGIRLMARTIVAGQEVRAVTKIRERIE